MDTANDCTHDDALDITAAFLFPGMKKAPGDNMDNMVDGCMYWRSVRR